MLVGDRIGTDLPIEAGVLRVYLAELAPDAPDPRPLEHAALRWVGPDELDDVDWVDADRAVVDDLAVRARRPGPLRRAEPPPARSGPAAGAVIAGIGAGVHDRTDRAEGTGAGPSRPSPRVDRQHPAAAGRGDLAPPGDRGRADAGRRRRPAAPAALAVRCTRRSTWRPGGPADAEVRVRAALLWAGEGAVLTGAAAAWWHGLLDRPPADDHRRGAAPPAAGPAGDRAAASRARRPPTSPSSAGSGWPRAR